LVSVVVPMYQVEAYLERCLDSVVAQSYQNLEVVLVDDGSTDRTAEIARGYVERDPRFRLVQRPNGGLGAARNTGLAACTGELLAFLDSDDSLPPDAYRKMVRTLVESGSDFVVGAHYRDEVGGTLVQRAWVKQLHAHRRIGVTLDDVPDVLANVFAWTKMFRRDFVERIGLRFPVGVRYEDQVPITRAYLEARAFDVIPATVYHWRKREDLSSITQQKGQLADLQDRLAAKREIAALLQAKASTKVVEGWYAKVFRFDVMPYLRAAGKADDHYWAVLHEHVAALCAAAPARVWDEVELRFRVAVHLAVTGQRPGLAALLGYAPLPSSNFRVESEGGALYARLDVLDGVADVPPGLLRLRPVDMAARTLLRALDWSVPARLGVRGLAFIRHVDPEVHEVRTTLTLRPAKGSDPVAGEVRTLPDPEGNVDAGRVNEDHTNSSFEAAVDLCELVRLSGNQARTTWHAEVSLAALGHRATDRFLELAEHGSALATRAQVVDGALVTGSWSEIHGLSLVVRRRFAALRSARYDDGVYELDLAVSPGSPVVGLVGGETEIPAELLPGPGHSLRIRVAPADLAKAATRAVLSVVRENGSTLAIGDIGGLDWVAGPVTDCPVALTVDSRGSVRLAENEPAVVVDAVAFEGRSIGFSGAVHGLTGFSARLEGPRAGTAAAAATVADGRFTVTVPARRTTWGGVETALPRNAYTLQLDAGGVDVRLRAAMSLQDAPPAPTVHGWRLEVGERRSFVVRRLRDLPPGMTSAFDQRRLQETVYADARAGERTETVVFECFAGTGTGDSPGAVCDVLRERGGFDLVWSVSDDAVPVPAGTRAVTRLSPEWYAAVGSARYLVCNNNLPPFFEKAAGQVHVQTWHGTPLKRIGHDITDTRFFSAGYLALMDREAASWDYLVSPSPFCTEVFPRAFAYGGQVLEVGYPRNDLLRRADTDPLREEVRAELGIASGQRVVLYAPTWRENAKSAIGYEKVLYLDAAAVTAVRHDVTVLVRGHANTAARGAVDAGDRVLDVTSYPDITRLYLAADVLVTDYSSVLFDFTLTDKPMLFLVPDLEEYRDRLRGFYFDLEEIAPGPLLRTTDEVLTHLDDDPEVHAAARRRMRERFAPHDDGHAAERLVDAVLGPA
jgi:CDP-glycerol glycerophosphotransferase